MTTSGFTPTPEVADALNAKPDHSLEHRPVEVPTHTGRTFTAFDHGYANRVDHIVAHGNNFPGSLDYTVRVTRRNGAQSSTDLLTIQGARTLAQQLMASADAVADRMVADEDAADR